MLRLSRIIIDKFSLISCVRHSNRVLRKANRFFHKLQFVLEWHGRYPDYFEHQLDLNFLWHETRSSSPVERGVFSGFALGNESPPTTKTLDLCCGDGFYSYYFYSLRSLKVVAIDYDPEAIEFAKRNYSSAHNIDYIVGDIRTDIPEEIFDNVIWDAAIHFFTEEELQTIMTKITRVLALDGILSGYTIVEARSGRAHLHKNEHVFHDKQDLARFLSVYFKNVHVFSTTYPDRTNLYYYASNGLLPFERENSVVVS